jgi:hypothetical protein
VLGKEIRGGAHPSSGASVGRRGVVAFDGGGACTVVADDVALALHHGEREREEGEVGTQEDGTRHG